jgi:hypothetical protein
MKRVFFLLAVLVVTGCETVPSNLVPREEPLAADKAYLAGVFFYQDRARMSPSSPRSRGCTR